MDEIINLFTQEHGAYQNKSKFFSIVFFILIIIFFTRFVGPNYMAIVIVVSFSFILTNFYIKISKNQVSDLNKNIHFKLESLQNKTYEYIDYKINQSITTGHSHNFNDQNQITNTDKALLFNKNKLGSLYIDANLIVFLYSIIKLYEYNPNEFYMLVKGTNNILKLKKEIEQFYNANTMYPENIHEMLEISIQLKANCMNNLHNIIYSVPKIKKMYEYIDNSLITYNRLITSNIKQIHKYHQDYIRKNGINTRTKFIDINTSKMYNPEHNHPIIPSKFNHQKLIDLYV